MNQQKRYLAYLLRLRQAGGDDAPHGIARRQSKEG